MEGAVVKAWKGIQRDIEAVGDAAHYAQNARFYRDGELQRRRGLVKSVVQSGIAVAMFNHVSAGYFGVYQTSSGTIEAVAAT